MIDTHVQPHRHLGFLIGLMAGTFAGAGLLLVLAPRIASEIRQRVRDTTDGVRRQTSARLDQVSIRVAGAVEDLTRKGQGIRDDVAGAVARGAREVGRGAAEVERVATAARSDIGAN